MIAALADLGIEYRGISQTEMYTSGAYVEQVLLAMRERATIDAILDRYRTKGRAPGASAGGQRQRGQQNQKLDADDAAAAEAAAEGSGAAADDDGTAVHRLLPVQAVLRHLRPRYDDRDRATTTRRPS